MKANKQNFIIRWFLQTYTRWAVGRHFHDLVFEPVAIDPNKSVLLIANHFSYWDSLILFVVSRSSIKKKFHVMVREDTTIALRFVRYGGAFSVKKGSRDLVNTLNYATALLKDPQNMVLIFPQGKLHANFVDQISFEKGIGRIMDAAAGDFQLIFAATFVQYLRHKKPTATVYLQNNAGGQISWDELQSKYQNFYTIKKAEQNAIVI